MNKQATFALIEQVKMYPYLYNMHLDGFRNKEMKDNAWESIGNELKQDAKKVKCNWKILYNIYQNALNDSSHARNLQSDKLFRKWHLAKRMAFLAPYPGVNSNMSTIDDGHVTDVCPAPEKRKGSKRKLELKEDEIQSSTNEIHSVQKLSSLDRLIDFLSKVHAERSRQRNVIAKQDALSSFFCSMCETTRSLPFHYQRVVKREIFQCVMKAEEKFLAEQNIEATVATKRSVD